MEDGWRGWPARSTPHFRVSFASPRPLPPAQPVMFSLSHAPAHASPAKARPARRAGTGLKCQAAARPSSQAASADPPAPANHLTRRAALAAGVVLPGLALAASALATEEAPGTTLSAPGTALVDAAVAANLPPQTDCIELQGVGRVSALGIGAWSWGDRTFFWGWNQSYGKEDVYGAYAAAMDAGISSK